MLGNGGPESDVCMHVKEWTINSSKNGGPPNWGRLRYSKIGICSGISSEGKTSYCIFYFLALRKKESTW
jgi:hypothetical protein